MFDAPFSLLSMLCGILIKLECKQGNMSVGVLCVLGSSVCRSLIMNSSSSMAQD